MTVPYRHRISGIPELFTASVFLVCCNRIFAVIYALIAIGALGESYRNACPLWKYMVVSLSNVGASSCQYEALKWVSFPVLLLGKSFKILPVMLWGAALSGQKYTTSEWSAAICMTWGVAQFLLTGHIAPPNSSGETLSSSDSSSYRGLLFLSAFLALDGFTCSLQEHVFREHETSKYNQMLYVNLGSSFTSLVFLMVTGELWQAILFTVQHEAIGWDVLGLSGTAIASQWFIYSQVQEFGAVVLAATMNARQVISISISYCQYEHPISRLQVLALCIMFGAIFWKNSWGVAAKFKQQKQRGSKEEHQPLTNSKLSETKV